MNNLLISYNLIVYHSCFFVNWKSALIKIFIGRGFIASRINQFEMNENKRFKVKSKVKTKL